MKYKIITGDNSEESKIENDMNVLALQGWKFKSIAITDRAEYVVNYVIIMEKE